MDLGCIFGYKLDLYGKFSILIFLKCTGLGETRLLETDAKRFLYLTHFCKLELYIYI